MHRMALPPGLGTFDLDRRKVDQEKQISLLGLESWRKDTKVVTHQRIWLKKVDMKYTT